MLYRGQGKINLILSDSSFAVFLPFSSCSVFFLASLFQCHPSSTVCGGVIHNLVVFFTADRTNATCSCQSQVYERPVIFKNMHKPNRIKASQRIAKFDIVCLLVGGLCLVWASTHSSLLLLPVQMLLVSLCVCMCANELMFDVMQEFSQFCSLGYNCSFIANKQLSTFYSFPYDSGSVHFNILIAVCCSQIHTEISAYTVSICINELT